MCTWGQQKKKSSLSKENFLLGVQWSNFSYDLLVGYTVYCSGQVRNWFQPPRLEDRYEIWDMKLDMSFSSQHFWFSSISVQSHIGMSFLILFMGVNYTFVKDLPYYCCGKTLSQKSTVWSQVSRVSWRSLFVCRLELSSALQQHLLGVWKNPT